MAGLYIHVPFCRQACRYCDFYFTVSLKYRDAFVGALLKELANRKGNLKGELLDTIYLGGGTPSVLSARQLLKIMNSIREHYDTSALPEISIEANPDDLSNEYLETLREIGFNRLSIGVQSFQEEDLKLMRRSHSAKQAEECLIQAQKHDFSNINMDLIYGLPSLGMKQWEENLKITMDMPVQHISAYHLTYEPGTVFYHWRKKGRLKEIPDLLSLDQYEMLRSITGTHAFEHYEISNFAKPGYRSKHNSAYWKGNTYLGFGPSAHSYNGTERQWNTASLKLYIEKSNNHETLFEFERLSLKDRYHDYLLTSLRTIEGVELKHIESVFGKDISLLLQQKTSSFISSAEMKKEKGTLAMTAKGWLRSDLILEDLMLSDDFILPEQQP